MAFVSAELKRLYELLIELGYPISASEAARLFAAGELADYVQAIIDMIAGDEAVKLKGTELYRVLQAARDLVNQLAADLAEAYRHLTTINREYARACDLMEQYLALLQTWREAEANYYLHKAEIDALQGTVDQLERQLDNLYTQISALYTEALWLQRQIDNYAYEIEMYRENVAYWKREIRQLERDLADCWSDYPGETWFCAYIQQDLNEASSNLRLAENRLQNAYATLAFYQQQKWSLLIEINAAWNEVNDIQAQIATIEAQIRELMGVLGAIDAIVANIVRYQQLYDYWHSEKFRIEAWRQAHLLAIEGIQTSYDEAVAAMKVAREAWNVFKAEHPDVAQEIIDEYGAEEE